ncbi:hypothetical protein CAPTEDRAFT_219381 [Capitella teleta]|uniref:Carbohydrate kinase PfkB domain-containing protein n=1 Tax=Capitella teleta TaxID=283909 RepID=R7TFL0_CAPTE|nr:hypothetical protein CAPTEDRAFT_219381 [Capitella teleta]|eukprot:ELT92573.1 hypothetical protein CAPTEDRAFT_219381 [Capitella teleta]
MVVVSRLRFPIEDSKHTRLLASLSPVLADILSQRVWFEPTDANLLPKLFSSGSWRHLTIASPNMNELRMLHACIQGRSLSLDTKSSVESSLEETVAEVECLASSVLAHIPCLVVTLGRHGVLLCNRNDAASPFTLHHANEISFVRFPSLKQPDDKIVSVSGAGDCLAAGVMHGISVGLPVEDSFHLGLRAALCSLKSNVAVPNNSEMKSIVPR